MEYINSAKETLSWISVFESTSRDLNMKVLLNYGKLLKGPKLVGTNKMSFLSHNYKQS